MMSYQFSRWRRSAASGFVFDDVICLLQVKIYLQTKLRRHISVHGWDITTSGLEKQMSAILEFIFWLLLRPYHSNRRTITHQATKVCPNRATRGGLMMSYTISIWRPRRLNTISASYFLRHCLQKVKFYLKTNFHQNRTTRVLDVTSSIFNMAARRRNTTFGFAFRTCKGKNLSGIQNFVDIS